MARSPVTNTIESFNALTEEQQKLFLDFVAPEPEPVKQTRKKRGRSPRAESLSEAIKKAQTPARTDVPLCVAQVPGLNVACGDPEESSLHDPKAGYSGYHPFESPARSAAKQLQAKATK